jgi:hypothetical protein
MGRSESINVIGKSGKTKQISIYDIDIKERIEYDIMTGKFYAYISRWYRLPEEYDSEYLALNAIMDFRKKYYY